MSEESEGKTLTLTPWDWTVLPAAWRYYEYRSTISSASFPGDVISKFFTGRYDTESCKRIARQFVEIDHHDGEKDWTRLNCAMECDTKEWCKFYAFLKAYLYGYKTLHVVGDVGDRRYDYECEAFWCEYTKRWYPKDRYIENPSVECWAPEEYIKEIR